MPHNNLWRANLCTLRVRFTEPPSIQCTNWPKTLHSQAESYNSLSSTTKTITLIKPDTDTTGKISVWHSCPCVQHAHKSCSERSNCMRRINNTQKQCADWDSKKPLNQNMRPMTQRPQDLKATCRPRPKDAGYPASATGAAVTTALTEGEGVSVAPNAATDTVAGAHAVATAREAVRATVIAAHATHNVTVVQTPVTEAGAGITPIAGKHSRL